VFTIGEPEKVPGQPLEEGDGEKAKPAEPKAGLPDLGGVGTAITAGFTVISAAGAFLGVESGTFSAILAAEPRRAFVLFFLVGLGVACGLIAQLFPDPTPPEAPDEQTGKVRAILTARPRSGPADPPPAAPGGVPMIWFIPLVGVVVGAVLGTFAGLAGFDDLETSEKDWAGLWTLLSVLGVGGLWAAGSLKRWRIRRAAALLVASLVLFGCGLYGTVRLILASRAAGGPVALVADVTGSGEERAAKITVKGIDLDDQRVLLFVDQLRQHGECSAQAPPGCRSSILLVPQPSGALDATVTIALPRTDLTELVVSVAQCPEPAEGEESAETGATDESPDGPSASDCGATPEKRARIVLISPPPPPAEPSEKTS
jgi:hypothetical protein